MEQMLKIAQGAIILLATHTRVTTAHTPEVIGNVERALERPLTADERLVTDALVATYARGWRKAALEDTVEA